VPNKTGGDGRARLRSCALCWQAEIGRLARCRASKRCARLECAGLFLRVQDTIAFVSIFAAMDCNVEQQLSLTCNSSAVPDIPSVIKVLYDYMSMHMLFTPCAACSLTAIQSIFGQPMLCHCNACLHDFAGAHQRDG